MGFDQTALAGKRIVVTGAGRGIGRACAATCARLGAQVIAVARTAADLDSLAAESAGKIEVWVNDVASDELAERIRGLDSLNGLINNAGTNRVGPMADQSADFEYSAAAAQLAEAAAQLRALRQIKK